MSASRSLFRLQQVDREVDRVNARLASIRETLENDAELRAALNALEQAKAAHFKAEQGFKHSETEVKTLQIKIEQTESSLYGGMVHNPKELQDLQKDIVSLKKRLASLEELELEAMQTLETAEAEHQQASASLEALQSRRGDEHRKLLEEQASLSKEAERLAMERQAAGADISVSYAELYEDLRGRKRGLAVAEIVDLTCAACGSNLTASLHQNARSTVQLTYCPSCGRILYAN